MKRILTALTVACLVCRVLPVHAQQVDLYARLGAVYSSTLLTDAVLGSNLIKTKLDIAPALTLGAALPVSPGYTVGIEAMLTRGGMSAKDEFTGEESDLGTVTTAATIATLAGPIRWGLRWRVGIGLLSYLPSDDEGIFRRGGTSRLLAGLQLEYRRPALRGWDLSIAGGADVHRFSTEELQSRGFGGNQGVARAVLSVGLTRARP